MPNPPVPSNSPPRPPVAAKPGPARVSSNIDPSAEPAFIVFDVETVPDGELIRRVRFPNEKVSIRDAVERVRMEILDRNKGRSDFLPVTYCYPVAVCVLKVAADFSIQSITCLDAPKYRPRNIVADFWRGLSHYHSTLVSFNGRNFDVPVLELAAFRFGVSARGHFDDRFGRRYRYGTAHLDLCDWLGNHGAVPMTGGLDLLSKVLGKPGKMTVTGRDVYDMFLANKLTEINDYCMFDVLDTYFVFLRTRVMTGEISLQSEQRLVESAHAWLIDQAKSQKHLQQYLENFGRWKPWV